MKTKFLKDREINYMTFDSEDIKEFKIDTIKGEDSESGQMIIAGLANKSIVDRVNDLILPEAWDLANFKNNPIIFFNHDRDYPIGKAIGVKVDKDGLHIKVAISTSDDPKIKFVRDMIAEGIVKSFSVGIKIDWSETDEREDGVLILKKVELLETSVVTVPANQESFFELEKSLEPLHLSDWDKVEYKEAVGYVKSFMEDKPANTDHDEEKNVEIVENPEPKEPVVESAPVSEKGIDETNQPHIMNQQVMINQLGSIAESFAKLLEQNARILEVNQMHFDLAKARQTSDAVGSGDGFENLDNSTVDNSDKKLVEYDKESEKKNIAFSQRLDELSKKINNL